MPIYNDNWDFLGVAIPKPERLQERALASRTIGDAGVQQELRNAFARLERITHAPFPNHAVWRQTLGTEGRYGYAYTGYKFFLMHGNFRRRTVAEGIDKVQNKLNAVPIVHNEKLYMDIVGTYVGASRLLKNHLGLLRINVGGQMAGGVPNMAALGVRRQIINPANALRNWLPRQRGVNPVYYPNLAVNERFLSVNGPSATTLDLLNFGLVLGCPAIELRALAWGLFAWWRLHNRPKAYHSFNEAIYILNDFLGEAQFIALPNMPILAAAAGPRRPAHWPVLANSLQ